MAKKTLPQKLHNTFSTLCKNGDIEGIDLLVKDNNIDINASFYRIDKEKIEEGGRFLLYEFLDSPFFDTLLDYYAKQGGDINLRYINSNALSFVYLHEKDLKKLHKLLSLGIEVDALNRDGNTKLIDLVREYSDTFTHDYDKEEEGGNWYRTKTESEYDISYSFIKCLLEHGANPSRKNTHNTSALDWLLHRQETGEWNEYHERLHQLLTC